MAIDTTVAGPERTGGQGLDSHQQESGAKAIHLLLTDPVVGPQTDFVATHQNGAYEVWAERGMIRFHRSCDAGGRYVYDVIETIGENPVERQDPHAVATIEEELEAARRSGNPTDDPSKTYIEPEALTYPLAYERIAQLFDSPNAPDIVVNPKSYAFGRQPGQHGTLDIVQSRAPLVFSGPGVRPGASDTHVAAVDIAPTICKMMGFPTIDGRDATGRPSSNVYLRRQDGKPIDEVMDLDGNGKVRKGPARVFILHIDGLSHTELHSRLEDDPTGIPNLRRIIEPGHTLRYGSIVTFPSITWPSHNTIGTGCWSGHHDIVNPTYYLRESREVITPQGQQFDTAKYLSRDVETLYEAFHRVYGPWQGDQGAFTAAIHEPCTRGADHSVLERRTIGDRDTLRSTTKETSADISDRWLADGHEKLQNIAIVDNRAIAQVLVLYNDDTHPTPIFTFCELTLTDSVSHDYGPHTGGVRQALDETDLRVGRLLRLLDERGLFDSTLFVLTADHGMAATRTELAANQVDLLPRQGIKAVVPPPLVYLLDMAIEIEQSLDGRTATITVLANDTDSSGEQPSVAGAEITVTGPGNEIIARATTDSGGVAGVPLKVELAPDDMHVTVHHDDYNLRHMSLDGTNVVLDLRELLYGTSGAGA